jgi:hypothetical protein
MSAGLRFDPPLTRLLERNNYRSALISYQQDRRTLIQFEDTINQTLRQNLRTLKQHETNLEIQRKAVVIAVRRVDQTREALNEPPAPAEPGQAVTPIGPTAASNLLTSLTALSDAQNNFMSVWLNHYSQRMSLMRDLGLMQLDDRGLWIDIPLQEALASANDPCPLPPDVPADWLKDAGVDPLGVHEDRSGSGEEVPPPPGGAAPAAPSKEDLLPQPNTPNSPSDGAGPSLPNDRSFDVMTSRSTEIPGNRPSGIRSGASNLGDNRRRQAGGPRGGDRSLFGQPPLPQAYPEQGPNPEKRSQIRMTSNRRSPNH